MAPGGGDDSDGWVDDPFRDWMDGYKRRRIRNKGKERWYYGGWSQFLAPVRPLYLLASKLEEAIGVRHADNCFMVGMIARKPA